MQNWLKIVKNDCSAELHFILTEKTWKKEKSWKHDGSAVFCLIALHFDGKMKDPDFHSKISFENLFGHPVIMILHLKLKEKRFLDQCEVG